MDGGRLEGAELRVRPVVPAVDDGRRADGRPDAPARGGAARGNGVALDDLHRRSRRGRDGAPGRGAGAAGAGGTARHPSGPDSAPCGPATGCPYTTPASPRPTTR